jgi:type II secretory ATPase GspE/PulE/Tfp pilus assembly ATPase PilB-like protein/CheY-like chemotaxis protein
VHDDDWLLDAARNAGFRVPKGERPNGISAWRLLLGAGVSDADILRVACTASGADAADFSRVSPALRDLLPHDAAVEHRVAPAGVHGGVLAIGTVNPSSRTLERLLAFASKQRVKLLAASPSEIIHAQSIIYGSETFGSTFNFNVRSSVPLPSAVSPRPTPVSRISVSMSVPPEARDEPDAAPITVPADPQNSPDALLTRLLETAVTERAAEVQLEPVAQGGLLVRLRIDGKWNDRFRTSDVHGRHLIEKLEKVGHLDTSSARVARSGRGCFSSSRGRVDLRIATEPVGVARERMTIRLYAADALQPIDTLGFSEPERARLDQLLTLQRGTLILAGPPASGRTTTMYALASDLRRAGRRIASLEEPITYRFEGFRQIDATEAAQLTLAASVRAALALDAGAVAIDVSSDRSAVEAFIDTDAPRLVLASLDATDFPGVVARLRELEVPPSRVAASVVGVVSQRLLRRLCTSCAAPLPMSELPEAQGDLLFGMPTSRLRQPVGCASCRGTGYAGRIAATEVVPITREIAAAIARHADNGELARLARTAGAHSLWDSGLRHVVDGTTSLGELLDTVPPPAIADAGPQQEDIDALLSQLLDSHTVPTQPSPAAPSAQPARVLRVLIVDEDAASRRALADALRQRGFGTLEAADGEAALTYVERLQPDLLLTDVAVPRVEAVGMLASIASMSWRPAVVIHTLQDDPALLAWLRDAGAKRVLPRTLAPDDLAQALRDALHGTIRE